MPRIPKLKHDTYFSHDLAELLSRKFSTTEVEHLFINGTSFEHDYWELQFSDAANVPNKSIDFRIILYDGSSLVEKSNEKLLDIFKALLIFQVLPRFNGGKLPVGSTMYYKVLRGLRFIDWVLLNGAKFEVVKYHFSLISKRAIHEFLFAVSTVVVWDSVYKFTSKVSDWLRLKISDFDPGSIARALKKQPLLDVFGPEESWVLGLSRAQLIIARVWLYENGYYKRKSGKIYFEAKKFIVEAYSETLHGSDISPFHIPDLILEVNYSREHLAVPVRNVYEEGFSRQTEAFYSDMLSAIRQVNVLVCNTGMPQEIAVTKVPDLELFAIVEKDGEGRYRSVPSDILMKNLRDSIEFYLKYAKKIITTVLAVLTDVPKKFDRALMDQRVNLAVAKMNMPIVGWTDRNTTGETLNYEKFRSAPSMCEFYTVFAGVSAYIVGMTMGRRQGELINLHDEKCLDPFEDPYLEENATRPYCIVFHLEKSGAEGRRDLVKRSIPLIVAKVLWDHMNLKKHLKLLGVLRYNNNWQLFQGINIFNVSFSALDSTRHNECLDQMYDYFQVRVVQDDAGILRRFYVRQHQLRRFWAQVFFWINGSNGLEVLAYFLGHTDPEMVYRYIVDDLPGTMLLDIKHERLVSAVQSSDKSVKGLDCLLELLIGKFNANSLHIKTSSEVKRDLKYPVQNGLLKTEPDFYAFCMSNETSDLIAKMLAAKVIDLEPEFIRIQDKHGVERLEINLCLRVNK
ncbi:hypothetical protein [Pseudomonas alkylphenolica]|uniref:hypothetical protein n=1 Tax=Pseudomonas alkylphenolica TaxID=237609 RepID=UPI00315DF996